MLMSLLIIFFLLWHRGHFSRFLIGHIAISLNLPVEWIHRSVEILPVVRTNPLVVSGQVSQNLLLNMAWQAFSAIIPVPPVSHGITTTLAEIGLINCYDLVVRTRLQIQRSYCEYPIAIILVSRNLKMTTSSIPVPRFNPE